MKHLISFFLAVLLSLSFILISPNEFCVSAADDVILQYDSSIIEQVGQQAAGSESCACFALAYCRSILDGYAHSWSEYDGVGDGDQWNTWGAWGKGNYNMAWAPDFLSLYQAIYDQINYGRPTAIFVDGHNNPRSSWHFVAVVGYRASANRNSLSAYDFYILDPGYSPMFCILGDAGYDPKWEDYDSDSSGYAYRYTDYGSVSVNKPVVEEKHRLTILYNANGGTIADLTDYSIGGEDYIYNRLGMSILADNWQTGSGAEGGLYNASTLALTKTGCRFVGWSTSSKGGNLFDQDDTALTANDIYPDIVSQDGKVTMYAQWENINCEPTAIAHKDDHLYALYEYPLSFTEAKKFCEASGGHLATITSAEENAFICDSLLKHAVGPVFWLGASDESREGYWYWYYGEGEMSYNNWAENEPNNEDGMENYLQILSNGKWNDGRNYGANYCGFILEIENLYPNKEAEYNNHIYHRFDKGINYLEALEYCHMIGGQLVTINDADENKFLYDFINDGGTADVFWIGLADMQKTKTKSGFKWIEDPDCHYQNWWKSDTLSQPDCCYGAEFYGEIYKKDGMFNDGRNYTGGAEGFICEFEKKVKSISISKMPEKCGYYVDEKFDPTGLELLVEFDQGEDQSLTKGFTIEAVDMTKAGEKSIVVSYQGFETTFNITVSNRRSPGDVNEDDSIDLKDVVIIRRALVNDWNGSYNEANADVNNDGSVDLKDVVTLRRYLVGWDIELV